MKPDRIPVGSGLPWWIDTLIYLSADEVRELPSQDLGRTDFGEVVKHYCCACHRFHGAEKAHIADKQAGGRKHDGPTIRVCQEIHREVHAHGNISFAIRRDGWLYILHHDCDTIVEYSNLGRVPDEWLKEYSHIFTGGETDET